MAARNLEGMFANIDVNNSQHIPTSPLVLRRSGPSDSGSTISTISLESPSPAISVASPVSVHSADTDATSETVELNRPLLLQENVDEIKKILEQLRPENLEQRVEEERQELIRLGEDEGVVRNLPRSYFRYIKISLMTILRNLIKNSRDLIPSLDDMISNDSNTIIRAVLLEPSFEELFDKDDYAFLKEKLGMENISGGRRKSNGRTRKHRHSKKSRKVRRKREGGSKKRKSNHTKTVKKHKTHSGLKNFWKKLASGKMIILVHKDGSVKKVMKHIKKRWKESEDDDNVVHVLTSSMSWDAFERLERRAKGASPKQILADYKKYFGKTHIMTKKDRSL